MEGVARKDRKVAIVGFAQTTRDLAPFGDSSFEIWGLNHLYPHIPRWDRWFDMHAPEWSKLHLHPDVWKEHEAFLTTVQSGPVFMLDCYAYYPSSVRYPIESVIRRFGRKYLTNGIAYMIALALFEGVSELHVYGVDMRHDSEYVAQRPCTEYWLGLAEGAGVKVVLPAATALLAAEALYGYDEDAGAGAWVEAERAMEARRKEILEEISKLNTRQAELFRENDDLVRAQQSYDGALQECTYNIQRFRQRARGGLL